jgi:hypothetical protein
LRVEFVGNHAGLRLAGHLSIVHLPSSWPLRLRPYRPGPLVSGVQDSQHTDGWTTAAVVIFWPAAFLVGGDKQTAAELAQMKGQMVAVEQASNAKKCGIQFQGPRPRAPDRIDLGVPAESRWERYPAHQ